MTLRPLCLGILAVAATAAWSQTSGHQRIGVEGRQLLEFSPSLSCSLREVDGPTGTELELTPSLGLDLSLARRISLGLDFPAVSLLPVARSPAIPARAAAADPGVYLGYSFRAGDWRLAGELSYRHPLGIWNYYEAYEKSLSSGSGYRTVGLALAATRFLDPLALGARLSAQTGLARPERFGSSIRPLDAAVALFATEALNDSVAVTLSIDSGLSAPRVMNGVPSPAGWAYSARMSIGLALSLGETSFRLSMSSPISDPGEAGRLTLAVSRRFTIQGAGK